MVAVVVGPVLFFRNVCLKVPLNIMRLLENVDETLVSSYFSSEDVVRDKFQVSLKNDPASNFTNFLRA